MDEFLIELQAKLDEAKSKGNINSDIDKIQGQIDKLKIQAEIDPKTISNLVNQLETVLNQKINISNIGINQSQIIKTAQQTGQQIGNAINQGVANATSKPNNVLKSFSDLRNFSELNKSISNFHVDASELKNYQTILDNVKNTYAEFGQVKITNETFNNGILEKFKVNIEQVNGDLKETKSFMMSLTEDKDAFVFNGLISGSESIVQHLDKTKNAVNQTAEAINALKDKAKADKIQLQWDDGTYESKYDSLIAKTRQWIDANDESVISTQKLTDAYNEFNIAASNYTKDGTVANRQKLIDTEEELARQIKSTTNEVRSQNAEYAKSSKIDSLHQKIQEFYDKNTATHRQWGAQLKNILNETAHGAQITATRINEIEQEFLEVGNAARQSGKLGKSFFDSIKSNVQSYLPWVSMAGIIGEATQKIRVSLTELKEVNTYLTEISKANDKLSKSDLTRIGSNSFSTASKYGKKSTDYLSGVQEASRAGYENAEGIAELSVAAQGAGDMTSDLSNQMIIATDKAYKMNGSVEKLTKVLDGMNFITNHNAVNMTELSEGMSIVGSTAASFGVDVNEATAALGTMVATTQQSGSEAARAFRAILLNIRQVSDEEEGIDAEGLTKYENACNALNVKLKETKNGILSLRDPMEVLKELSVEYNKLDESDIRRTNLLSSVGGKVYHVIQKCITRMNLIAGNPLEPCTTI